MSRLDSFIRRLEAQRACLGEAARLIETVPGPVLEFGLGNGRTYDHLRKLLPRREIFVFDRQIAAHPACIPDDRHMILGDLVDTLATARRRIGAPAALVHSDVGSGDKAATAALAKQVAAAFPGLLAAGAIVVSDQPMSLAGLTPLPLPSGVATERYFLYRYAAGEEVGA